MMKYVKLFALFLMIVFCSFCNAQNKTELPTGNTRYETKGVITSCGPGTSVRTIKQDRKGNIWLASNEGIIRYDGKSFRNFTTKEGLSNNDVTTIIEDKTGKFWFGTRGNAFVYDGKAFTVFTNKDSKAFNNVWSIIEDKKGNIWLSGSDGKFLPFGIRL